MRNDAGPDATADPKLERLLYEYLQGGGGRSHGCDADGGLDGAEEEELHEFAENCAWMRRLAGLGPSGEPSTVADDPPGEARVGDSDQPPKDPAALSTIDAARCTRLKPHASGGLGEVFTAYDAELHRTVALKRIRDDHAHDPRSQRHFLVEAEVTARLDHPGVVPVVHSLFRDDADRSCYTVGLFGDAPGNRVEAHRGALPRRCSARARSRPIVSLSSTSASSSSRSLGVNEPSVLRSIRRWSR